MTRWTLDVSHSSITFSLRHKMGSRLHGRFGAWVGSLDFDEEHPMRARISLHIDARTVDTQDPEMNELLRSSRFFNVEQHPEITFHSTSVSPTGDRRYRVIGDLMVGGVTNIVALTAEHTGGVSMAADNEHAGFVAHGFIDRRAFELRASSAVELRMAIGEQVELAADLVAVKARVS